MIFFGGNKRQQPQHPLNSGVIKLAAALLIVYVITVDYREGHQAVPQSVQVDPAEPAKVAVDEKIVDNLTKPEAENVPKHEIVQDPKLEIEVIQDGKPDSAVASYGDTVLVKYTGVLADQTVFVDTHEIPASFVLGDNSVIPALEQGIAGMHEGEVRQLIVPPELGYNPPFHNDKVPANTPIAFIVKLMDVQLGNGKITPPLPFKALDEVVGTGEPVKGGDKVSTRYTVYNATGMQLVKNDTPHGFVLGQSSAPQDYAEGIVGMKPGGKRLMILPPLILRDLETDLPKYQLLHIEVELVAAGETVELTPEVAPVSRPQEPKEGTEPGEEVKKEPQKVEEVQAPGTIKEDKSQ